MKMLAPILVVVTVIFPAGAFAQVGQFGLQTALTVPLGCQIKNEKVIQITNTTGAAIANTNVTFDAVRKPDRQHYGRTVKVGFLAAGGIVQIGGEQSYSCTAWFRRVPVLAPN